MFASGDKATRMRSSAFIASMAMLLFLATPASAQVGAGRLSGVDVPALPGARGDILTGGPGGELTGSALQNPVTALRSARRLAIRALIDAHGDVVDADPRGEPVVRNEILALSPSPAALNLAGAAGFVVIRESMLGSLDLKIVSLAIPAGLSPGSALRKLRRADPDGTYDYNHIYFGAGRTMAASTHGPGQVSTVRAVKEAGAGLKIGLVDAGVSPVNAWLDQARIRRWGCDGQILSSPHGTAVASLLVGSGARFAGVLPHGELYAADIYCGTPTGGNALTLVAALAWLAQQGVSVINISLVGPANEALEQAVHALKKRDILIVAAVGNDGPTAPPLYPAAYPDVVGVTGVDGKRRVLPEAVRGPQVAFAAPGTDMAAASDEDALVPVRGTSFAAPLVAGLLALERGEGASAEATGRLAATAIDLGKRGPDETYGAGLVGEHYRVAPGSR